jgi:hypothetical protein
MVFEGYARRLCLVLTPVISEADAGLYMTSVNAGLCTSNRSRKDDDMVVMALWDVCLLYLVLSVLLLGLPAETLS